MSKTKEKFNYNKLLDQGVEWLEEMQDNALDYHELENQLQKQNLKGTSSWTT